MSIISRDKSEWATRKKLIDPRLKAAGWRVVPFSPNKPLATYDCCAIEEFPTENGPADYALCVSGKILGIVEAKKLTLGPQNVLRLTWPTSTCCPCSPRLFSRDTGQAASR